MRKNGTLQAAISWAWELADNLRTHTQLGTLPALRSVVLRIVDQIIAPLERIDISVPTNGVDNDQ
jgi:hypothetical protein